MSPKLAFKFGSLDEVTQGPRDRRAFGMGFESLQHAEVGKRRNPRRAEKKSQWVEGKGEDHQLCQLGSHGQPGQQ